MSLTAMRWAPSAAAVSGSWASIANAAGKATATYASWSSTSSGASAAMEGRDFDVQSLLPAGATINQVRARVEYATNRADILDQLEGRFYNGSTALGSAQTMPETSNTVASHVLTLDNPSLAQVADLRVRIMASRPSTTTSTVVYVDRIGVEVDYTASGGWPSAPGEFSIWPDVPSGVPTSTGTNPDYTLATQFEVTAADKYLRALRFWRPADGGVVSPAVTAGLFRVSDTLEVPGSRVVFGDMSGDPVGGWVTRQLPAPVPLDPGEQYVAACHFPSGTPVSTFAWTDLVNGPVRAASGPNARLTTSAELAFPTTSGVEQSYWVDVVVGDAGGPEPGRGAVLLLGGA